MNAFEELPESLSPCRTPGRYRLTRREEHARAIERLLPLAERRIDLLTPHLEPALHERPHLQQILRRNIARHRRLLIRILVFESGTAVRRGSRLIELAREFPSFATIRQLPEDLQEGIDRSFLLVDDCCCLSRTPLEGYQGILCCNDPGEVRRLRSRFDELWEHAFVPPDLRRLHL